MERQFFSGNTIEQALMAAARYYGLDPDRVAYSLRDKKHGFLNIRRRVVIEVDPEAPEKPEPTAREEGGASETAREPRPAGAPGIIRRSEGPPERRDAGPRPAERGPGRRSRDYGPRSAGPYRAEKLGSYRQAVLREFAEAEGPAAAFEDEDWEDREIAGDYGVAADPIAAFEKAAEEVIALLGLGLEASARREGRGFEVELTGTDRDLVVADGGELLGAIEHLLPRLVRGLLGRGLPCRVDCAGFRAARETELKEMAGGMAELARRQGKAQLLEPLNPAERRVVHLELADDPTVETESDGDGFMKRVRILPSDDVSRET